MRSRNSSNVKSGSGRRNTRKPSDVFTQCPACESPNIFAFEGDVFCTYCDWNTIILRADAMFDSLHLYEPGLASVHYINERGSNHAAEDQKNIEDFKELMGGDDDVA